MLLKYFYEDKIAHASYLVGCQASGEAIVIDPGRDLRPYLAVANAQGLKIIAATETHIHADFVSGTREMAEHNGARLYLSDEGDAQWKYQYLAGYDHQLLKDGATFMIGNIKFEVMHSPGHTPEHLSFIITDTAGANQPMGIVSGDFVFVGDIGRPDLLEEAAGLKGTAAAGARQMFKSVQRFKQLPDHMQLWPAHGAGSACGRALGAIPSSTVGYEKLFNAALAYTDEEKFITALLAGQPEAPRYFATMKKLNKVGPPVLKGLPQPEKLDAGRLGPILTGGATVIDTRSPEAFAAGHIPGTLNIPANNDFTNWAGWLLDYDRPFYLIAAEATANELVHDLIYIGLDNLGGYFDPAVVTGWPTLESYEVIGALEVAAKVRQGQVTVVDIRANSEWAEGHIPGAKHVMLGYLPERAGELPPDKPVLVHCRTNGRSPIGVSVLQAQGIKNVLKLAGGYLEWAAAGLPVERVNH
jgi:hydroxyacylglutathione hydrolase